MAKILLIDDDELVVKSLVRLLEKSGYDVAFAQSAVDALSLVANTDFDLVISDIRMPGESGVVAVEKIQKIYKDRQVACGFIFISGYSEEDTPAHAIRLGISAFIDKPFDINEILKTVADELELVANKKKLTTPIASGMDVRKTAQRTKLEPEKLKRAVITGIGAVAPNGIGKKDYWEGLRQGMNCIDQISAFDISSYPSKMAAEVKNFNPKDYIKQHNEIKRMGRAAHLAVAASILALEDAGLPDSEREALSVIIGSGTAGIEYIVPEVRAMERGGIRRMRPYLGIAGFGGAISSEVSRAVGAKGPSYTLSTGCTSSTDAMGYALKQIRYGLADKILTGGADACVNEGILGAFCQMGAVSTRNDKQASRPFNKDRDGFVIAEGSWVFLLEELEAAQRRGAKIYGEIVGYGANCDAWHMSKPHPSGEGTAGAIQLALQDARLEPTAVDVFEAYGNATPVNDSYETGVVKKVFGEHARKVKMPSVKSMLGHPIGAAGAQQVSAALLALNEGILHPTINYQVPDPECDLDYVPNQAQEGHFKVAVCNSLAFGAKNASLVIQCQQ